MMKLISIPLVLGGLLVLVSRSAIAQVAQEEFTLVNPTSKAKLWAAVFYPADAGADNRYPAVVIVPGGLGFGSGAARTPEPFAIARAGFVVGYFDPDGRGRSEGQENFNGKVHQDGLHAVLEHVAGLTFVDKSNIGVVSSSLGLAMAAGALGRYPDDPPVKYFIDIEGPSDRFYITKFDDRRFARVFPRDTKDEEWWAEREAVRSIKEVRCAYLRVQHERDHVHGENKQHAIDMVNAATHTKFGGKGKSPWTRINDPDNAPNVTYAKDNPPKWLPAHARPPRAEQTLRWIEEMAGTGGKREGLLYEDSPFGFAPAAVPPDVARTKAFCVVHCDPVPEPAFPQNWAMLEDLVATADTHGAKLSLHFTGSYATLALRAGKAETVRRWLANGHGVGTHPHPEYAEGQRWMPQVPWTAFPQERVAQAMQQATEAVNQLAGAANNLVLDTLFPFYTSPASFPDQYTHFAWGNNGHSEPVPLILPRGRTMTAVFYRTLPGEPRDPFHITAAQMAEEFKGSGGTAYGPVLHPLDFQAAGKRELTAWFRWLKDSGIASLRLSDLRAKAAKGNDEGLRLWCEVTENDGARKVVVVHLENCGKAAVTGVNLTAYLPPDYSQVALDAVSPKPTEPDSKRPRLFWRDQTVAAGATMTCTIPLTRIAHPVNHPISGVLDVYFEGGGTTPSWSCITLTGTPDQGWYLPFESYNPTGRVTSVATRTAFTPPPRGDPADRPTAERIRKEVLAQPTNKETLEERLALLFAWAQAFLRAGRQAELDTVLPPQKFQSLEAQVQTGDMERVGNEIDRALLGLANLLAPPDQVVPQPPKP